MIRRAAGRVLFAVGLVCLFLACKLNPDLG
jgi:hypothetical protein